MKTKTLAILTLGIIASSLLIPEFGNAFGQTENLGFEPNTTQSIIVIGLGFSAGLIVAYQGYRTTPKNWDTLLFFDSVIKATLVSIPLAVGSAITQTNLGIFEYVTIFGSAMGYSWQLRKTMKPTINSNEG